MTKIPRTELLKQKQQTSKNCLPLVRTYCPTIVPTNKAVMKKWKRYRSCRREVMVCHQTAIMSPFLIFPRGYLVKSFPHWILPQDTGGFKSAFHLLGELQKAIEPHLPVCRYIAGNSVPLSGLHLQPSHYIPS